MYVVLWAVRVTCKWIFDRVFKWNCLPFCCYFNLENLNKSPQILVCIFISNPQKSSRSNMNKSFPCISYFSSSSKLAKKTAYFQLRKSSKTQRCASSACFIRSFFTTRNNDDRRVLTELNVAKTLVIAEYIQTSVVQAVRFAELFAVR